MSINTVLGKSYSDIPRTLVGIAMRLCIELGLHRRKRSPVHSIRSEMEKKLFWSCYYLDRELSLSLGRPPSISDHDIDAQASFQILKPILAISRTH